MFYDKQWEMRNFILHYYIAFFSNLSWIHSCFVSDFTVIIRLVIWTIRNLAFSVNIVIIEYRISCFICCISHTYSQSYSVVNHCHISKNHSVSHIKTECPVQPAFVAYESRSFITGIHLIRSWIGIKLNSVSSKSTSDWMSYVVEKFIFWCISASLTHHNISCKWSSSNYIVINKYIFAFITGS